MKTRSVHRRRSAAPLRHRRATCGVLRLSPLAALVVALVMLNIGFFAYAWHEQAASVDHTNPVGRVILGRSTGVADPDAVSGGWRVGSVVATQRATGDAAAADARTQ
ncbi:MAG: hypothetical protein ACK4IT_10885 [Thioalkalivibrionaceae bacterium]